MFNTVGKRIPYILGALPFNLFELPRTPDHSARSFFIDANENETGWDRLYYMWSYDEFGNRSPEMNFVVQGASMATLVGVVWGGIVKSRVEYMNFIERNHATKFSNMFEAKRKLQDTVTLSFARGAFQWGWRLGLFTGSYILITTSIATYRGKSSLIEYAAAGFLTGTCYKFSLGPKGMLVGGALGGVLGGVAGVISLAILRLSGTTMEEIRYWQYNWKKDRDRQIEGSLKKARAPDTLLEKEHDFKVGGSKELIPEPEVKSKA